MKSRQRWQQCHNWFPIIFSHFVPALFVLVNILGNDDAIAAIPATSESGVLPLAFHYLNRPVAVTERQRMTSVFCGTGYSGRGQKFMMKHSDDGHANEISQPGLQESSKPKATNVGTTKLREGKDNMSFVVPSGITLKMAFDSSDVWGVADLSKETSERFTSTASLDMVHRLRRCSDCVLVGKSTVERDNCTLTVRRVDLLSDRDQPVRVVIDPGLSLIRNLVNDQREEVKYSIFNDGLPLIVYCGEDAFDYRMAKTLGALLPLTTIVPSPLSPERNAFTDKEKRMNLSIQDVVQDLTCKGFSHIMVEGGPFTAMRFLEAGLIDRAVLIRAIVQFKLPLPSNISESILRNSGLNLLGTLESDGDVVECWSRANTSWPTENLASWP